jgi:hypothetical protein
MPDQKNRVCPRCKTPAQHETQTLCTNCQGILLVERPGRGRCFCCGEKLAAPLMRPGITLTSVGGGFFGMGGSIEHSCLRCGDPHPTEGSGFRGIGSLLVGLQVLAWSIIAPAILYSYKGPYQLSGGKAALTGLLMLVVLMVWTNLTRIAALLAVPLFILLTFWPFVMPWPDAMPDDIKMKIFIATLIVNLISFSMLVKVRRKPFANWF